MSPGGPTCLATTTVVATSSKGKSGWLNDVQTFASGESGAGDVTYEVFVPK